MRRREDKDARKFQPLEGRATRKLEPKEKEKTDTHNCQTKCFTRRSSLSCGRFLTCLEVFGCGLVVCGREKEVENKRNGPRRPVGFCQTSEVGTFCQTSEVGASGRAEIRERSGLPVVRSRERLLSAQCEFSARRTAGTNFALRNISGVKTSDG